MSQTAVLRVEGLSKRFGGAIALRGANLEVKRSGEIHAVFGENGSGKSTLLNALAGLVVPDSGTIAVHGQEVSRMTPRLAHQHGISMVTQETALALDLTVAENILMGRRLPSRSGIVQWQRAMNVAQETLAKLRQTIAASSRVRDLRPDQRQMVEIARAISREARILILDEPTSSLTENQTDALFETIRYVSSLGVSTLFVSHRLAEINRICETFTVLRDGATVGQGLLSDVTTREIVELLTGRPADTEVSALPPSGTGESSLALSVDGVQLLPTSRPFDLHVRRGAIVGVAGTTGSGCYELLAGIAGVRPLKADRLAICGVDYEPTTPRGAIRRKIGYLPPDRKSEGLVLVRSVRENLVMPGLAFRSRLKFARSGSIELQAERVKMAMRIKAPSDAAPVASLSGGNQQKVALGKWLVAGADLLILDEPTRGVDVGAKREIHDQLRSLTHSGKSILVYSSENDELLTLCDEIYIFYRGNPVRRGPRAGFSEGAIAHYAGGGE
jgi:ABC-type sugar transport system ATPase subunit